MEAFENGRTLPAKTLDFWFDYTCPYAYLASTQAKALAERMGTTLAYRPMLLGGVFMANGTPQKLFATLSTAKGTHNGEDMDRWAKRFGVPLRMPPNHPIRSVEALRATLASGTDPKVVEGFYRAYWVDGDDISSRDVIAKVLGEAGHDAAKVLAGIDTPAVKDDLRKRTDEAIALGIFGAPAWVVDGEHLYWGQDRMQFVEGVRAEPRADATAPSGKTLDVYWDFSSPFAYLGSTQVEALAKRTGAKVVWKPLLLGGLFRAIGTPDAPILTFSEAKRKYIGKDIDRWAAYWGVPFSFPSRFPTMTVKALRLWLALPEPARTGYRERVFRAYWVEDKDMSDVAVLSACVGDEAIAKEAIAKMDSDEVKGALRAATEEASAKGVFGVPTFVVDGQLFWGQDRLDLVEAALLQKK